eukprot:9633349-Heterocapsa_arctica.AAC.1
MDSTVCRRHVLILTPMSFGEGESVACRAGPSTLWLRGRQRGAEAVRHRGAEGRRLLPWLRGGWA